MLASCRIRHSATAAMSRRMAGALRPATGISTTALSTPRRGAAFSCPLLGNIACHTSQLILPSTYLSASTLLYSPLGTAMMLVLAYNMIVIIGKHLSYTMDLTSKDYVQDQDLNVIMHYGMLCCILLGMEAIFVEV